MPKVTIDAKLADQLRQFGAQNGVVELVDESGRLVGLAKASSSEFEYRPLPPYGTPEFYAEIERRASEPGPFLTVEESLANLD